MIDEKRNILKLKINPIGDSLMDRPISFSKPYVKKDSKSFSKPAQRAPKVVVKSNQDRILDRHIQDRNLVNISCMENISLDGYVIEHDKFTISVISENVENLIYKHAICKISFKQKTI